MKIHRLAIIVCLFASAAAAQPATTMTFTTSNGPATNLGGDRYMGSYYTGTSAMVWADGKKTPSTFTCVSTSNPPNNRIFDMTTVCDIKSGDGNFTSVWGCNVIDKEKATIGCVGGLQGQTGIFSGRNGAGTFSGSMAGGTGTGQWSN